MRIIIKGVKMDITYAYRGGYPKELLYTIMIPAQKVRGFTFESYTENIWADELRIENKSEYKHAKAMWYVAMPDDNQLHLLIRAEATIQKAKKEIRAEREKIAKHKKVLAKEKKELALERRKELRKKKGTMKSALSKAGVEGKSVQHQAAYLLYAENQRMYSVMDKFAPTLDIADAERLAHKAINEVMNEINSKKQSRLMVLTPYVLYREAQERFVGWACNHWKTYSEEKQKVLSYWMASQNLVGK